MPWVIATKTISADVLVWNTRNHPQNPKDGNCRPELTLKGHQSWYLPLELPFLLI